MKIVWVSHGESLGGAEMSLWEAATGLAHKGAAVYAVLPARGALAERLERDGIPVSVFSYPWWAYTGFVPTINYRIRRLWHNLAASQRLAELCRQLRADVVVTNTMTTPVGAFAARWARLPHVWYIRELYGRAGQGLSFDLGFGVSQRLINRLSERVVVNSSAVREQFRQWVPWDKLRLVYNGVEVRPPLQAVPRPPLQAVPPEDAFRLVMVGRIAPGKRQEDAIRAVALLARKGINARLTLLGDESKEYGRFVRGLASELGVEHRVDFVAFTENPSGFVAASDLALMCSRGEAFGRVTVEAMKLGKPVVGADSAGTAELIRDGVNGFLYNVADAVDLAAKIETLYHDRALLARMGQNARQWASSAFTEERYITSLLNVFAAAITAHAERSRRKSNG